MRRSISVADRAKLLRGTRSCPERLRHPEGPRITAGSVALAPYKSWAACTGMYLKIQQCAFPRISLSSCSARSSWPCRYVLLTTSFHSQHSTEPLLGSTGRTCEQSKIGKLLAVGVSAGISNKVPSSGTNLRKMVVLDLIGYRSKTLGGHLEMRAIPLYDPCLA